MKKTAIIFLALSFILTGSAFAGGTADNCGCGLGTMIFDGNDGLISQIAAATTNGSFGNQTFGISSAIDKFFEIDKDFILSSSKSFFLVERISNIKSSLLLERLKIYISQLFEEGLIKHEDVLEIKNIYYEQIINKANISAPDMYKFKDWYDNWQPFTSEVA